MHLYVRKGNYPYAILLNGANEKNLSRMLDNDNESKSIDELFGDYKGWVESNGAKNTDWYKK